MSVHLSPLDVRLFIIQAIKPQCLLYAAVDCRPYNPRDLLLLILVCKQTYHWITPLLYHTIHLTSSRRIIKLATSLKYRQLIGEPSSTAPLIQQILFGPTPESDPSSDLMYGSTSWPSSTMNEIFAVCPNIRSLTFIGLGQNAWCKIEGCIPASLESLAMGPIHGPLVLQNLSQRPRLRSFTSVLSHIRPEELFDLIICPDLRWFRIIGPGDLIAAQLINMNASNSAIEKLEYLFIGPPGTETSFKTQLQTRVRDKRVVVTRDLLPWRKLLNKELEDKYVNFVCG